jgi:hypothetical protein
MSKLLRSSPPQELDTVHMSLPLGTGCRQLCKSGVGTGRSARLRLLRHDVGVLGSALLLST